MSFDKILRQLRPIDVSVESEPSTEPTVYESLEKMLSLAEKVGKTGYRAAQSSEFMSERFEAITQLLEDQIESRERDLRTERARIGELEDEISRLVRALIEVADLGTSAVAAARRELNEDAADHFSKLSGEMLKASRRAGLEATAELSQLQDPEFHEVVDEVDESDRQAREIMEIVRQGYRYRGKLVRVAKVVAAG